MELSELRTHIRRWAPPIVIMMVIGALIAYGVSRAITPLYRAQGTLLVRAAPRSSSGTDTLNLSVNQVTSTYAALITQDPLLRRVIGELHLNETTQSLANSLKVTPNRDTQLVDVAATDPSADRSAAIVNTLLNDFVSEVARQNQVQITQAGASLETQITQLQQSLAQEQQDLAAAPKNQDTTSLRGQIQANGTLLAELTVNYSSFRSQQAQNLDTVTVTSPASTPPSPASPQKLLNTGAGAFAGLLLGAGLAFLLQYLDQGLRDEEDVRRRLDLPTLAIIPIYRGGVRASRGQGTSVDRHITLAAEGYRRLRTNLLFAGADKPLRSIVVTSARASEGKTRTAANLAAIVAAAGERVLLVDADMRRPSQHKLFGKPLENGMSEMLLTARAQAPTLNGQYETPYPNLGLVTAGVIPPNPSELLASKSIISVLRSMEQQHDLVVVDTPPADVVTDPLSVAAHATGTVLVIEAGKTSVRMAQHVIGSLRGVGANVLGVVLNKANDRSLGNYYYYDYTSGTDANATPDPSKDDSVPARNANRRGGWIPIGDPRGLLRR